jgi:hypothetical protein
MYKLIAALLTFTLGVILASLWLSLHSRGILPGLADLTNLPATSVPAADGLRDGGCEEWAKAGVATQGLGWDLTYMPLLRSSGVCPGHPYCGVATEKPQPPVNKYFAEWQGDSIVSSILIELPDGHADMMAIWLVRTKEHAYWWGFHPHRDDPLGKQPIPTREYDRAFETMECWRQYEPSNRGFFDGRGDGYIGFLSLYKEGKSRQMLLTDKDIFLSWPKGSAEPDEDTWGRLRRALKPIYLAIRNQQKQSASSSK